MGRGIGTALCADCGKEYTTLNQTIKRTQKRFGKYVCPECAKELGAIKRKNTFMARYGQDNPGKIDQFKEKRASTNMEKYGGPSPFSSGEIQSKIVENRVKSTGYANPAQNPEVYAKIRATNLERYGVENVLQNPEIKQKCVDSLLRNGTIPTSKRQIECFNELKDAGYNVFLNFPVPPLFLDILIIIDELKIDFEYDGWFWHKDKAHEDYARDVVLRKLGYKVFRVKAFTDTIPDIAMIEEGIRYLADADREFYRIEI